MNGQEPKQSNPAEENLSTSACPPSCGSAGDPATGWSRLKALGCAGNRLLGITDPEQLFRRGVELARTCLGFERAGIWLFDEDCTRARGTYGTDPQGNIRDEHAFVSAGPLGRQLKEALACNQGPAVVRVDLPALDDPEERLGPGSRISALLSDGDRHLGYITVDNALTHRPLTTEDEELLSAYAMTLGQSISRRLALKARADSEARFARIFQSSPDAVLITSLPEGRIIDVNESFSEVFGYQRDKVIGRTTREIGLWADPVDRDHFVRELEKHGRVHQHETPCRRVNGELVVALTSAEIVELDGQRCILGVTTDITNRKRAEEDRARMQAALLEARKLQSLGVMAGGVSHDFSNLLTVVMGNLDLLRGSKLSPLQSKALASLDAAAQQAGDMVRLLQAYAHSNSLRPRDCELNTMLEETSRTLLRVMPAGIDIELELSGPLRAHADQVQLQQVLVNLCLNARDAMPDGGSLRIKGCRVARKVLPDRHRGLATRNFYIAISVSDSGVGMSEDMCAKAFDPYFTTKGLERGTGLGLAIVHKIIQSHGGLVEIESRPGQGTSVTMFIPALEAIASDPAPPRQTVPDAARILVVDDEEMIANLLRTALEQAGHTTQIATRPEQALALARGQEKLDLVVLDYVMPEMSGDDCLSRLREHHPGLPAVIISGGGIEPEKLTAGNVVFLPKPFCIPEIMQAVNDTLGMRAARVAES